MNIIVLKSDSISSDGYFCGIKVCNLLIMFIYFLFNLNLFIFGYIYMFQVLIERIVVDEKGLEKIVQVELIILIFCNIVYVDECKIIFSVDIYIKGCIMKIVFCYDI